MTCCYDSLVLLKNGDNPGAKQQPANPLGQWLSVDRGLAGKLNKLFSH